MRSVVFKILTYLVSCIPILIIFSIINYGTYLFSIAILLSIFIIVVFVISFNTNKRQAKHKYITITEFRKENGYMFLYIALYILPFFKLKDMKDFYLVSVLIMIALVKVYTLIGLSVFNPFLTLFGYNIYCVEYNIEGSTKPVSGYLITKNKINGGDLYVKEIDTNFYIY